MKPAHFCGVSSSAKIASTGQAGTHAPQSMHSSGWMYSISAAANVASSFRGWMQSTGQTSTHAVSFVPTQGSQMIYATVLIMIAQTCDPALTVLFTPEKPRLGHYEVCTTEESIEAVADPGWTIEALDPLDAFGNAGSYDRFAISRLYGGRRARVAHGWRETGGRFESITLISPHPDASLTKLVPGTMMIIWRQ
jgi:hypothetical protein